MSMILIQNKYMIICNIYKNNQVSDSTSWLAASLIQTGQPPSKACTLKFYLNVIGGQLSHFLKGRLYLKI